MTPDGNLLVNTDLIFEGSPGFWFYSALILAAIFLVVHYLRLMASASRKVVCLLISMRLLLLAVVLAFMLKPTILKQKWAVLKLKQPLLVDTSRSMSLRYDGDRSRFDIARKIIADLEDRDQISRADLGLYSFDETINQLSVEELEDLEPRGRMTNLYGALADVDSRDRAGLTSKVLVLTDGRHNGPHNGAVNTRLVLVGIGNKEPFRDFQVANVRVAELGFKGKPVDVTAIVKGSGFQEQEVSVVLKADGKLVGLKEVLIPRNGEKKVEFQWTASETGIYQLEVETKLHSEEKIAENNILNASVKIVRDRIRILLISGSPTWNYRFLREALKRDPSIDLISFIILRSPTDVVDVPQDKVSLIPFPTEKIFTEELGSFDLVIFDNFACRPYLRGEHLDNLLKYVENGGAFWIWGGQMSFANGWYQNTPVEGMLPFGIQGAFPGKGYMMQEFSVHFTPQAEDSPIFNLKAFGERAADPGRGLPRLAGFNIVGPARNGAVVLAEHSNFLVESAPQPIIAVRSYGKGRVMGVATDFLWAWDFIAAGEGVGNRIYLEFIKNSVRWLTGDPLLSPVNLTISPESPKPGETVVVSARVLDDLYRPVDNASLDLKAVTPLGERINLQLEPSGHPGIYETEFRPKQEGSYRFSVEAAGPGGGFGQAQALLSASGYQKEMAHPEMDGTFLQELAASSGGAYLEFRDEEAFYDRLAAALENKKENTRLLSEEKINFGSLPAVFFFLLTVLIIDWAVRKRFHLE